MSDPRPAVADALRLLREGRESIWVTLRERRLHLAPLTESFVERGEGLVLLATRRGYRVARLTGRRQRYGVGSPKLLEDGWRPIAERRLRAIVLALHDRPPPG